MLLPLMAALGSCQTFQTGTNNASPTAAPTINTTLPSMPCSQLKQISYAAPKPGQVEDAANLLDSKQTIEEIREQNAAIKAVCGS